MIIIEGGAVPSRVGHYHSVCQRGQSISNDCHLHGITRRQVPENPLEDISRAEKSAETWKQTWSNTENLKDITLTMWCDSRAGRTWTASIQKGGKQGEQSEQWRRAWLCFGFLPMDGLSCHSCHLAPHTRDVRYWGAELNVQGGI